MKALQTNLSCRSYRLVFASGRYLPSANDQRNDVRRNRLYLRSSLIDIQRVSILLIFSGLLCPDCGEEEGCCRVGMRVIRPASRSEVRHGDLRRREWMRVVSDQIVAECVVSGNRKGMRISLRRTLMNGLVDDRSYATTEVEVVHSISSLSIPDRDGDCPASAS